MTHETADVAIDPVCGMQVTPGSAAATTTLGGRTWHFCAESCKEAFDAAPGDFARENAPAAASCCSPGHSCH